MFAWWKTSRVSKDSQKTYSFDAGNGYAQVERKDAATNRAYGEWNMLRTIGDQYNLWDVEIAPKTAA